MNELTKNDFQTIFECFKIHGDHYCCGQTAYEDLVHKFQVALNEFLEGPSLGKEVFYWWFDRHDHIMQSLDDLELTKSIVTNYNSYLGELELDNGDYVVDCNAALFSSRKEAIDAMRKRLDELENE